jgi:hypothetical protein
MGDALRATAATMSARQTASKSTGKLVCDKWRPVGIAVLLTDKDHRANLECQG